MSDRDTSIEPQILTSLEVTFPSVTLQVPASAPPSHDTQATLTQATVTTKDIQTPLLLPTKPEPECSLGAEAHARGMSRFTCSSSNLTFGSFSEGLWQKAYGWHQQHGLRADNSLEGRSTEQLVQYMMEERGFKKAAARLAVSVYPARVLAKLHRQAPNGMPTVGQLRAASDEEWEEKSRHQA